MKPAIATLSVVLFSGTLPAAAGELFYVTEIADVAWTPSAEQSSCTLSHPIARYGEARYYRATGYPLTLELRNLRATPTAGTARLTAQPPGWKPGSHFKELGKVTLRNGPVPVHLQGRLVNQTLEELEQGMNPTFGYALRGGDPKVWVQLSAISFRDSYEQFLDCIRSLTPAFQDVRFEKLYFDTDSAELTQEHRDYLDRLTEYLWNDVTVREIKLQGFADARGSIRYNKKLSLRRAANIREYLIAKGLPEEMIKIYAVGRIKPKKTELTDEFLRESRRVELEVRR